MLVLMGMVMMCLVADENGDSQQLVTRTATSTCMTVLADDFDLDNDDDDEVANISFVENKAWPSISAHEAIGQKTKGSKCSQALLRGQVRRYSPRNNLSDGHNYTLLSIMKSGVDLFHATFFVPYTSFLTQILHNAGTRPEVGSRSIFQTTIL